MAISYNEQTGTRGECLAVDSEQVKAELSRGNFLVSTSQGTYMPEKLTINYIGSLFTALSSISNFWETCNSFANQYIANFEDVPEPESIPVNTDFLNNGGEDILPTLNEGQDKTYNASVNISSGHLNVRSSPNGKVVGQYKKDDKLNIVGKSEDGKWYQIKRDDGTTAYVYKDYVTTDSKVASVAQLASNQSSKAGQIGLVNTSDGGLNFREDASKNSKIIESIPKGTRVEIVDYNADKNWAKVSYNGKIGYLHKDYFKLEEGDK